MTTIQRTFLTCLLALTTTACSKKPEQSNDEGHAHDGGDHAHADGDAGHEHPAAADAGPTISKIDAGASVDFGSPTDGATVEGPAENGKVKIPVKMLATKVKIQPAGQQVDGTGHHHIIIDGQPVAKGTAVPADDTHIHYGKGQTETEVELTPGEHTLTLQLADGYHLSYGPELSKTIKITVAEKS